MLCYSIRKKKGKMMNVGMFGEETGISAACFAGNLVEMVRNDRAREIIKTNG